MHRGLALWTVFGKDRYRRRIILSIDFSSYSLRKRSSIFARTIINCCKNRFPKINENGLPQTICYRSNAIYFSSKYVLSITDSSPNLLKQQAFYIINNISQTSLFAKVCCKYNRKSAFYRRYKKITGICAEKSKCKSAAYKVNAIKSTMFEYTLFQVACSVPWHHTKRANAYDYLQIQRLF